MLLKKQSSSICLWILGGTWRGRSEQGGNQTEKEHLRRQLKHNGNGKFLLPLCSCDFVFGGRATEQSVSLNSDIMTSYLLVMKKLQSTSWKQTVVYHPQQTRISRMASMQTNCSLSKPQLTFMYFYRIRSKIKQAVKNITSTWENSSCHILQSATLRLKFKQLTLIKISSSDFRLSNMNFRKHLGLETWNSPYRAHCSSYQIQKHSAAQGH